MITQVAKCQHDLKKVLEISPKHGKHGIIFPTSPPTPPVPNQISDMAALLNQTMKPLERKTVTFNFQLVLNLPPCHLENPRDERIQEVRDKEVWRWPGDTCLLPLTGCPDKGCINDQHHQLHLQSTYYMVCINPIQSSKLPRTESIIFPFRGNVPQEVHERLNGKQDNPTGWRTAQPRLVCPQPPPDTPSETTLSDAFLSSAIPLGDSKLLSWSPMFPWLSAWSLGFRRHTMRVAGFIMSTLAPRGRSCQEEVFIKA